MINYRFFQVFILFAMLFGIVSCQETYSLDALVQPSGLQVDVEIATDTSGVVTFDAKAENAINYHFYFGNSSSEDAYISLDGKARNVYSIPGEHDYTVRVIAFGTGGLAIERELEITVRAKQIIPQATLDHLFGNGVKKWVWLDSADGHIGLGEQFTGDGIKNYEANWWKAGAKEKQAEGCLYVDTLIFRDNSDGTYSFGLNNFNGVTFFRQEAVPGSPLGQANPGNDQCYEFEVTEISTLKLDTIAGFSDNNNSEPTTHINMTLDKGGFLSFYLGVNTYEILELTEDLLRVRAVQNHGTNESNGNFTWYQTFRAVPTNRTNSVINLAGGVGDNSNDNNNNNTARCTSGGATGNAPNGDMTTLVWADEFNEGTSPCPENWKYDIGRGSNGWGNGEAQYYTRDSDNIFIKDGMLNIVAKKEKFGGADYTSARILTQDKYDFRYGKIEIRAKVPPEGGTWPAAWMLGSNFATVGWPQCGEIDIMEHIGNDKNVIHGTLHYPERHGGNANGGKTNIPSATTDFHVYAVEWSSSSIDFFVDGNRYFFVPNSDDIPFNHKFFIILNLAIGGSFGGSQGSTGVGINPNFTEATYQIDYVRVYK